jgi:hypothetical protein
MGGMEFYNRQPLYLKAGDNTSSWPYTGNISRPANGNPNNCLFVLMGLPEEILELTGTEFVGGTFGPGGFFPFSFVAFNGAQAGLVAQADFSNGTTTSTMGFGNSSQAVFLGAPVLGVSTVTQMENGNSASGATWLGTELDMLLTARWRG